MNKNLKIKISIYVKPNARQTKLLGKDARGFIIALKARPQDGEANAELIRFLAEFCHVPKTSIVILRGESSRHKQIEMPWNEMLA